MASACGRGWVATCPTPHSGSEPPLPCAGVCHFEKQQTPPAASELRGARRKGREGDAQCESGRVGQGNTT